MDVQSAVSRIPARELTKRGIWLGVYLASVLGRSMNGQTPNDVGNGSKEVAAGAVRDYDEKFPQSQ